MINRRYVVLIAVTHINSFSSHSSFCRWENRGIDIPSNLTMATYLLRSKANSGSPAQGTMSLISGLYSVFAFPCCSLPFSNLPVVFSGKWGHFSEASQRLLLFLIGSHWLLNQSDYSFLKCSFCLFPYFETRFLCEVTLQHGYRETTHLFRMCLVLSNEGMTSHCVEGGSLLADLRPFVAWKLLFWWLKE